MKYSDMAIKSTVKRKSMRRKYRYIAISKTTKKSFWQHFITAVGRYNTVHFTMSHIIPDHSSSYAQNNISHFRCFDSFENKILAFHSDPNTIVRGSHKSHCWTVSAKKSEFYDEVHMSVCKKSKNGFFNRFFCFRKRKPQNWKLYPPSW